MKAKKMLVWATLIISSLSLLCYGLNQVDESIVQDIFSEKVCLILISVLQMFKSDIVKELSLAIFGSALLGFVMSLLEYFSAREVVLREFFNLIQDKLSKIESKTVYLDLPEWDSFPNSIIVMMPLKVPELFASRQNILLTDAEKVGREVMKVNTFCQTTEDDKSKGTIDSNDWIVDAMKTWIDFSEESLDDLDRVSFEISFLVDRKFGKRLQQLSQQLIIYCSVAKHLSNEFRLYFDPKSQPLGAYSSLCNLYLLNHYYFIETKLENGVNVYRRWLEQFYLELNDCKKHIYRKDGVIKFENKPVFSSVLASVENQKN